MTGPDATPGQAPGTVDASLERFFARLEQRCSPLDVEHDVAWSSPCLLADPTDGERARWRPIRRLPQGDLSGLERALDQPLHPDVATFFTTWWSGCVRVRASEGEAVLIQVWNHEDFERLQANLIGHALAKSRAGLPLTAFVACTDEGDLTLSVDNATGEIVLENPGEAPQRTVARSLAELLDRLEPIAGAAGA